MISDFFVVNQRDINIIKQQFTCLLHTIGKYIELFFPLPLRSPFVNPNGTHIKYLLPIIFSPFSCSLTYNICFSIEIQTYIQNVGDKRTHTRIQTYEHSNTLITREKEKGSEYVLRFTYKMS